MKNILIIFSKENKISGYAEDLRKGAESNGNRVTLKETDNRGELITCHPYDVVIVGSKIEGFFDSKIPGVMKQYLARMKRTEGKKAIAFINHKLIGTSKGVRKLMGVMESEGFIVKDFRAFSSGKEALEFGKKL